MRKNHAKAPPSLWFRQLKYLLIAFSVSILASLSTISHADDDTELYASHQIEINPDLGSNILFVFDQSYSLESEVIGNPSPLSGGTTRLAHLSDALLLLVDEMQGVNVGFATFSGGKKTADDPAPISKVYLTRANVPIAFPVTPLGQNLTTIPGENDPEDKIKSIDIAINSSSDDAVQQLNGNGVRVDGHSIYMSHYAGLKIRSTSDNSDPIDENEILTTNNTLSHELDDSYSYMNDDDGDQVPDHKVWLGHSNNVSKGLIQTGFRFKNLGIPQGSTIHSAYMTVTADRAGGQSDNVKLIIKVVDQDNVGQFTNETHYITNLPTFSSAAIWSITETWTHKAQYNTVDFTAGLQNLIDANYWDENDAAVIIMTADSSLTTGQNRTLRKIGDSNSITKLTVTYSLNAVDNSRPKTTTTKIVNAANHAKEFTSPQVYKGQMGDASGLWLGGQYHSDEPNRIRSTLIGLRFQNVKVPKNAIIRKATLKLSLDDESESHTDDNLNITIFGEDTIYAKAYSENDSDLSSRSLKDTSLNWNVKNGREAETIKYSNLTDLIKSYVNDEKWREDDNAISLILAPSTLSNRGRRGICGVLNSCYRTDGHGPELEIEWTEGEPLRDADYQVGLRFQSIKIPQGAIINEAYLEFNSNSNQSASSNFIISAAAVGSSAEFEAVSNNINERDRVSTTVNWNSVEAWKYGQNYQSPELKRLVQKVVNQGRLGSADGWCSGLDMVFFIDARSERSDSLRQFNSYDSDSSNAPKLHIEYDESSVSDEACVTQTKSYQITASNNDGEETTTKAGSASDAIFLSDHPLEMSVNSNNSGQKTARITGYRFNKLGLTSDLNIINAELVFTASHDDDNAANLTVYAEKGNARVFSRTGGDFSKRISTSATVAWKPGAWIANQRYRVNVTDPVRENLSNNWVSTNNLAFFVKGRGLRRAYAFDNEPNNAALLKVTYTGRYADYKPTARDRVRELIAEQTHVDMLDRWTPIVPALYESAQYYLGGSLYGGDHRAGDHATIPDEGEYYGDSNKVVSHRGSFTGGLVYSPNADCRGTNHNSYACRDQVICTGDNEKLNGNLYDPHKACIGKRFTKPVRYQQPIMSQCTSNYIVLLTDGHAESYDPLVNTKIKSLVGSSCESTDNAYEQCGLELVEHLYKTDVNAELDGMQNVTTHTIGFAVDNESGVNYLKELANVGGGNFYSADNATSLITAFRDIVRIVRTNTASFAAPTLSINAFNRLFHNNEVYFALFQPSDKGIWTGNIKKYSLCTDTENCALGSILDKTGASAVGNNDKILSDSFDLWNNTITPDGNTVTAGGTGNVLPTPATRKIYTNTTPSGRSPTLNTLLANTSNTIPLPPADNGAISNANLKVADNTERAKLFNWIYGYKDGNPASGIRDWRFGDPLHSSPNTITYDENKARVFSAGNDGMIRSLDAETGIEKWAFIPYEMMGLQKGMMDGNKYPPKTYGIDGTSSFLIQDSNGNGTVDPGEKVSLFIGSRRGGAYIYSLDVSNDKPILLWAINGATTVGYEKLGQTWSTPKPTTIRINGENKLVLIFGGGYDDRYDLRQNYPDVASIASPESDRIGNAIFIADAETGELLWSVGHIGSGASMELSYMRYPIPSDITIYDSNGDGLTNRLYVGDMGGQVWRIDLAEDMRTNSRGSSLGARLALLADINEDNQQRHFYYAPDIVQLQDSEYSFEQQYDLILITSGFRANPIGSYIQDRFYAIRDRAISGLVAENENSGNSGDAKQDTAEDMPTGNDSDDVKFFTLQHSIDNGGVSDYEAFYNATDNVLQVGDDAAKVTAKANLREKHGLFVDLIDEGEKGLSSPIVLGGKVFFTTFVPPGSVNTAAGGGGSNDGSEVEIFDPAEIDDLGSEFNTSGGGQTPDSNGNCTKSSHSNKICHYPVGNVDNVQVICVGSASLGAHYSNHSDIDFDDRQGACPSFSEASLNSACNNNVPEGSGKLYSLEILTGIAASNFNPENDGSNEDIKDTSDRSEQLGEGIPSHAIPIFLPEGITVVVGTAGGLHRLDETLDIPKQQVYWMQE